MNTNTFAYKVASEISEFVKNNYKKASTFPSIEFYWNKKDGAECSLKYILKENLFETKGLPTSKIVTNDTVIEIGDTVSTINMICSVCFYKLSQRTPWRDNQDKDIDENYLDKLVEKFYSSLYFVFQDKDFDYKVIKI